MADFELLGADGEDVRVLHDHASGYAVALAGHPSLAAVPSSLPRYDVIVALGEVAAEHGFRIDHVPSTMPPAALAAALAGAYAMNRTADPPNVRPIPDRFWPDGVAAGVRATYRLRDMPAPIMEQLWLMLQPCQGGVWALHQTTRFHTGDLNVVQWAHLRASMLDQHRWGTPHAELMWPTSRLAKPTVKLDLTDEGWSEAVWKSKDLGELASEETKKLADVLIGVAMNDWPPRFDVPPQALAQCTIDLRHAAPRATDILTRNLGEVRTALDLRAWVWQCIWAVGNRESLPRS